ncbi:MAG: type III-A CRISPR-associated protein Cas10/Csm1 [Ignavibacteriaceae bacterium]|jgi:CRISPR-associated protein Csm1|nr:type III-A CRISPR-associated protein Cas10/Csm1 [Ignavibacteriaceae bacterium]
MTAEEKTLILGALFHDIGKFEQRCTGNPDREKHPVLGVKLAKEGRFIDRFTKIVGNENISNLINIISEHHNQSAKGLTSIVRKADRLSASERVDKEETAVYQDQWNHKHLVSLFSKIKILSDNKSSLRYYKHSHLTKDQFDVIIPSEATEKDIKEYAYKEYDWNLFKEDLEYVLDIYENDDDFESVVNLLLVIFEKYMWCFPDFTGSSETDISLYNHLKDVAGLSHAIYLTQTEKTDSKNLNIVIGDIPGIQNYIFDVVNRKPAKILRGRSIFVQILTRNLATKLLKAFGLTEVNLIMLAGGKFYIVAPDTKYFNEKFESVKKEIEEYLFDNFRMEIGFNCAYHTFDYSQMMKNDNHLTFGQIVEEASHKLIQNRHRLFYNRLFDNEKNLKENYIWGEKYIDEDGSGTDSVKCNVTDKPIREGRKDSKTIPTEDGFLTVDEQVAIEYKIGSKIVGNDLIAVLDENGLSVNPENIMNIKKYNDENKYKNRIKILLNPTFTEQLKKENLGKDVFRNTYYLEVANYCSRVNDDIMPFEEMVKEIDAAKFLSLIKGDIDNLGLIMAYGLTSDQDDLTAISRTTTLSNHLKYYFSFFLNGFLEDWEKQANENKVYTIFAGGDDLMLIAPQSSAVKLIKALNEKFTEFSCSNEEVHISYSVTHFKDHTPIRIVSDFADKKQKEGKKFTKHSQSKILSDDNKKSMTFLSENDKAGTFLFETFLKNSDLEYFIKLADELTEKANEEKSGLSRGLIRRLLELSEMLKKYEETDDAAYLIAFARLNHTVNRLLKDKDKDIVKFFENVLTINKDGKEDAQKIQKILYPLVCQVIYNIRK